MKATTLPSLWAKNAFKNVHFAIVDFDAEPEVAQSMIGDRGVPQLILFQKSEGKWSRHYIAGMQTVESVEAFLNKANHVQIANATENINSANGIIEKK
jgi:thioredoxin-like negative regulator of GroEL